MSASPPSRRAFLICALLLGVAVTSGVRAQELALPDLKHFKRVRTVTFDGPETLLIAQIEYLDIDAAGRFLVTDILGEQVLLFDSTGSLQASLDSSVCEPGFTFSPESAHFRGDESIFVLNSGDHWGYRFNKDGTCLGKVDREFDNPRFLAIDPAGTLYGAYVRPTLEMRRMSATGETLSSFSIPKGEFPNANNRLDEGGLVADGTHLFYAAATEPAIMKFALDGTLVGRISKRSSWFRSPRRDLPRDLSPKLFEALREWESTTTTWSLFELTDETLLIQYFSGERGIGYQVFSKDGTLVAEELDYGRRPIVHGENGLVYFVMQPGLDSQGDLPNPYVEIYRFVAP